MLPMFDCNQSGLLFLISFNTKSNNLHQKMLYHHTCMGAVLRLLKDRKLLFLLMIMLRHKIFCKQIQRKPKKKSMMLFSFLWFYGQQPTINAIPCQVWSILGGKTVGPFFPSYVWTEALHTSWMMCKCQSTSSFVISCHGCPLISN